MLDKLTQTLQYHGTALQLRAERQRIIAGNIANADTPNYVARDFKFNEALRSATEGQNFNRLEPQQSPAFISGGQSTLNGQGVPGGTSTTSGPSTQSTQSRYGASDARHIPLTHSLDDEKQKLGYAIQAQPNMDKNTVDMDRERANFVDNAVRFEATLRFINGNAKTMLSAIQGQ